MQKRRSLWTRIPLWLWLGGGCAVFVLLLATVAGGLVWNWSNAVRRDVEAELARLEAEGTPTTPQALNDYYRLPVGLKDNTTDWLAGSMVIEDSKQFDSFWDDETERLPTPAEPWPRLAEAEEFLRSHADALEALHRAAEGGGWARFPVDYSRGWETPLDHLSPLRRGARLLQLEAFAFAHRGESASSARSILAIFMAARSLENAPDTVAQLLATGIRGLAREAVKELLPETEFADADLRSIQAALRGRDPRTFLRLSLIGERVNSLHSFHHSPGSPPGRLTRWSDCRRYLDWVRRGEAAIDEPWPTPFAKATSLEREIDAVGASSNYFVKWNSIMAMLHAPVFEAMFAAAAKGDSYDKACDAAIAAELYRRVNGQWPERLESLVPEYLPEVPLDLYTNRPLIYRVLPDGIVVYGVGPNRIDDQGSDERAINASVRGELDFPFKLRTRRGE